MRVLMFGWEFPPYVAGGLATATLGLVKGLLGEGVDVTLVVPFPVGETAIPSLRLLSAGDRLTGQLTTRRIATPLQPYADRGSYAAALRRTTRASPGGGSPYGADLLAEVERFADLAAEIASLEPHDVIDAHDWITFPAGLAARRMSGRPLVAHIHATEIDRLGDGGDPMIRDREAFGMARADLVIANSNAIREICVSRYGVSSETIRVIHWGIDPEGLPEPATSTSPLAIGADGHRPPTVLFFGRVTRQKGPGAFVEVAARVAQLVPDARFVLAGTGDLLPQVIEQSAELGIADRIFFAGRVSDELIARLYRLADVCVMTSVSEPFGLVALESIRQGTPCIVPASSGVAEVLRSAYKVDFWDIDRMTELVVTLLEDTVLHDRIREAGLAELALPRFGLEEPARRTRDVYAEAIAARG